jgi:putative tryptophan/tyrosine transport system substrate-binding protein
MRRRDFLAGLLLTIAMSSAKAQERATQHRIAIVIPAGPVAFISEISSDSLSRRLYQPFFAELRRLGEVEGQNLTVERYSGEGRPEGYADLARSVVSRNPDVIVAVGTAIALAVHAATGTIPTVWIGGDDPVRAGLGTSLAHPSDNVTGVHIFAGDEIWGKSLQILKDAIPSLSKVAFLTTRTVVEDERQLRDASPRLGISVLPMLLQVSSPAEVRRVFTEIVPEGPDAIIVSATGELSPYRQLIVELVEKSRLPAMYPYRDYVEAGGLMAYSVDFGELGRRMADDVHQILGGAKPGDIPIYRPTKYELVINLKAAKELGLAVPPSLLALADEVIE